jgi:hypothetical protein
MADITLPAPTSIPHLLARRITASATKTAPTVEHLAEAIAEITLQTQIAGASQLHIAVIDPQWQIQRSGWLAVNEDGLLDEIEVNFPIGSRSWWRLCSIDGSTDATAPNLTLIFEDRIVAYLRDKWGPKTVKPGTTTRAQFIHQLVQEVGHGDGHDPIQFVCPSINVLQPVASSTAGASTFATQSSTGAITPVAAVNKGRGVGHGAAVTVKGAKATPGQIAEINTLLGEANQLNAGPIATQALICAAIGESTIGAEPGSFQPNSAGYRGVLQAGVNSGIAAHDTATMARYFMIGGKGFQAGGALALSRSVSDPGEIATRVEASGQPGSFYGRYLPEAKAIIAAYGGATLASQGVATSSTAGVSDVGQLTRGNPQNPDESSWDAIQRLAGEVHWFAFSNSDVLFYLDGPDFRSQQPALYLKLDVSAATPRWVATDAHTGKKSVDVVSQLHYTVDNTSFLYGETHKVKGKIQRRSRIAKPQTPAQVQLNLVCEINAVNGGDVIVFQDAGPINGRWIVADATRNCLSDTFTQLTLTPPTAPYPEPQGAATPTTAAGGAGSTAVAGGPGGALVGGYTFPLPTLASVGRVDRGQDMETKGAHDVFVAMGPAVIIAANTDFPGLIYEFTDGPLKGKRVFHGHTHACLVNTGQKVSAGQPIGRVGHQGASYDGAATHIEIGFYPWSNDVASGTHHTTSGGQFHDFLHASWPSKIPAHQIIA